MFKRKLGKSVLTVILSIMMVLEMIVPCFTAFAAANDEYQGGAGTKISDLDTSTKYSESLGDNASTEYAGRIWTDKSVYTDDVTFATYGGGESTVKLNEGGNLGEDFLIAYSALATSQSVTGQTQAPVDVVFIIDISGSMSNNDSEMDNGYSRIANTVSAVNDSIETLMEMNEHTRVAVVTFSSTAEVLLPLDHYSKMSFWNTTYDYLSLSSQYAGGNVDLYARAVGAENGNINKTRDVSGGTNIQAGLYTGMNVLASEQDITADVNGQDVTRIPSVILLSDGAPTFSSSSESWWAPANNDNDGPGSSPYYGNGFKALMTGAYMKNAIDKNYKIAGTSYATTFYTIGMGISELENYDGRGNNTWYTGEQDLAYFTLNPKSYWSATNDMAEDMVDAWTSYTNQTPNGNQSISVKVNNNDNYTVKHPQSPLSDIYTTANKDALKNLVDSYYDADNASAVNSVFDQIVSNISISAPQVPTEVKGTDHTADGYITYTDPVGEYMEVKDIKAIIYAGQTFTNKQVATDGNTTTYTFSGEVHSAVYGDQEIGKILITVTETDGKQTLVIMIPASVIPLRVNEVTLNADGTVKTHTNNGAFPARVVYSVGLQSEVTKKSDDGTVYIDRSKISEEYLSSNTNADGTINFYSNEYTNMHLINGSTVGDTMVEFEPSHSNKFYYILEDMPIYKDAEFKQQVSSTGNLDNDLADDTGYYYKDEYYHGSSVEVDAIERTGAQLKRTAIKVGEDGYLYREAGSPRLNRILKFEGTKTYNRTNTAEDFYAPEFHYADGSTNAYDGKFIVHLGNNGLLSVAGGGNLQISKTVNAGIGLTAPDKSFEFTIDLDGSAVNQGEYDYVIVDAQGATVGTGTVSKSSPKISLKDGQTATVFALPPKTTYTVTETVVDGFTTESEGTSGTITAGQTSSASFTNTYNVTPVTYPAGDTLKGTKVLERPGNVWTQDDVFKFIITPYNNAPLPEGYNADTGVIVSSPDSAGGNTATVNFGSIKFTAPGTYRYTIAEDEPENDQYLPGMSYSRALYRVVVTVVDNGNGTLSVTSSDIQKLYDDNANQLFTYVDGLIVMNQGEEPQDSIEFVNTYNAESVTRVPVAMKDYTDNSGQNPLVSGMFDFKLEAVGIVDVQNDGNMEDDPVKSNTVASVPMPEGSTNGTIITTNEGRNVTFPAVTFTQNDIPEGQTSVVFRYRMSEVVPTNAVNGMKYDTTAHEVNVVVSVDSQSHILNVSPIYPDDERIAIFKNEYTPIPVTADIVGNKTLNGRDMKSGEEFVFELSANAETGLAMRNGFVTVPQSSASVKNAENGVATAFAFEDIVFNRAGTYVFTVSESNANKSPAVEYDDSVITVTIVVDDTNNDGNLEVVSTTYSNGKNSADFTNTYEAEFDGTPIILVGNKKLTGKSLLAGEFYFEIEEYFNGSKVSEGLVTHTADQNGNNGVYTGEIVILNNVTYDKVGTYEYYITEQIPETLVGGTEYDTNKYRYTVVIEDKDYEGKLTVKSATLEKLNGGSYGTADAVEFTNTYTPNPTTATLPVINKVIHGDRRKALESGEFKFRLSEVSSSVAGGMELPATTVVSNDADGYVVFDSITFKKAGTYVVSIKEVIPADNEKVAGITYSTEEIIATFSVVDDRNGNLTATLENYSHDTFVNTYTAEPAEVTIDIKKNFTGRSNDEWLSNDKFDFEVVILDPDTQEAIENGKIEFPLDNSSEIVKKTIDKVTPNKTISGKVKINAPGTYKFIVREINGGIPGVIYDSAPREITIEATDVSETAQIKTTVKIDGVATDNYTLAFKNSYDTLSTEISGHDHLTIEKIFTGREDDKWLDSDEFEFTLAPYGTVTQEAVNNGKIIMPNDTMITVSNANKAHPHFGNIVFKQVGDFEFVVTEQNNGIEGVTYDSDNDRIVKVNVADNGLGQLVAQIAPDSESLTFTNTYSTTDATLEGATKLKISKSLVGRNWFGDDEFEFELKPLGEATQKAVNDGDVVMPATVITVKAQNGYEGSVEDNFENIIFKKPGNYNFVIAETQGSDDNIQYDSHPYDILVVVTDNNKGALIAEPTYFGSSEFENTYTPDAVPVEIEGKKKLDGNRAIKADDFEFTVTALTADAPMPERVKVTNDAEGNIDFGKIEFAKDGTYVYEIKETKGNIKGVTYDENKVTATVVVTYDKITGKLSAKASYLKENEQSEKDTFTFENYYKAEASEPVSITAKKNIRQDDGNNFALQGGEFKFAIKAERPANAPMPDNINAQAVVSNDANGIVDFGEVKFEKDGTYVYKIYEVEGELDWIDYDGEEYTVTVNVTDDTVDAKLKTSVKITNKANSDSSLEFYNKYNPKETTATIFGTKVLEGGHKTLAADMFEFTVKAVTENAPMPTVTTVKNNENGTFEFGKITYNQVGTYKYEIAEKDLGEKGYTYDGNVYTVSVIVTDEGKGSLVAKVDGVGTPQTPEIKFVNKYVPESVDVVLGDDGELTKELDGREINENEFVFAVLDGENNEVATAENTKDGKFQFALNFTKADTYNYTIVEKDNSVAGITYDKNVYGVEVVVADKGGYLEVSSVDYTLENKAVEKVVFSNKYEAADADIALNATKKLLGRDLADGEFKFVLLDEKGNVVSTATNTKDGKIVFDSITFTDVGTYKYTVYEENGTSENVTYDKTEYIIEIKVTDEGKGKLVVGTPVIKKAGNNDAVAEIIFENTYTVPTPPAEPQVPQTGDNFNFGLWLALMFVSGLGLVGTVAYGKKSKH